MLKMLLIGWITVVSSVGDASVMVDENDGVYMHGKQVCLEVQEGRHLIMVDKEGYVPYQDTLSVCAGENRQLNIWLEPKSAKASKRTSQYDRTIWDYEVANGKNQIRWVGMGAGIGTGIDMHLSIAQMRFGLFTLEPCLWGMNIPFYTNTSHVSTAWLVHPQDRRSKSIYYDVAIPNTSIQFYYTPMVGVALPIFSSLAFGMSAGPQISWTRIVWNEQVRELPLTYAYTFTENPFPKTGFQFDPMWFSVQAYLLFSGYRSDLLTYFKYQDGYTIGLEIRF